MIPIILGDFSTQHDVLQQFEHELEPNETILLAHYDNEGYDGEAFVLVDLAGELFEVHAYHCSCYRLEGQWEREAVTTASLRKRMRTGMLGDKVYSVELAMVLDRWEVRNGRVIH